MENKLNNEEKESLKKLDAFLRTLGELTTITTTIEEIGRMKESDVPLFQMILYAEQKKLEEQRLKEENDN